MVRRRLHLDDADPQAPAHTRLTRGFDHDVHARLVRTNWGRTAAWTLLGLLDLWLLTRMVAI